MAATRSTSKTEAAGRQGAWVGAMVVFGLAFALTAVACYDPMIADGHLTCTADADCPSGFFCATNCGAGLCYHNTAAGQELAKTCAVVDTHGTADGGTAGGSGAGGIQSGGSGGGGGQTGADGGVIVGGGAGAGGAGGGGGTIVGTGGHGGAMVGGSGGMTGGAGMTGTAGATGMGGHVGAGGMTASVGGQTGAGGVMVSGSGGTQGAGGKTGAGGAMGLGGATGLGGAPGLGLGATCSTGTQCASGFCVDKVCCNVACADQCSACDISPGTCSVVASGPPHGSRPVCVGTGPCGSQCRLITPASAACVFAAATVSCGAQTCSGSTLTAAAMCNGVGACGAAASGPCPLGLTCNAANTACLASCATNADCTAAVPFCNPTTHQCTTARPVASSCSVSTDCQNGLCIDGFCCDGACSGSCEACNNPGQPGHCSLIPAGQQPHGARAACGAATDTCGAQCNGTDAQCHFPLNNSCDCPGLLGVIPGTCDGTGRCSIVGGVCLL